MIEQTSAGRPPPTRPTGTLVISLFLVGMLAAACSVSSGPPPSHEASDSPDSPSQPAGSPTTTAPSASSAPPPETGETPIKITIADAVITARLADIPTAQALATQLPLTVTFTDFNEVEKIAKLPRPLSLHGAPAGADPDIRDIGYYAPSGDLVFYYGEVGYFNGIVRIGQFDTTMQPIEDQVADFKATIERAGDTTSPEGEGTP